MIFTPAQERILVQIADQLKEHFTGYLLVISTDTPGDEFKTTTSTAYWHGGIMHAIGMAEHAKAKILRLSLIENEEKP